MSETPEIIKFAEVVEQHLNGGKIISYESRYLTKPGDNYGSCMLSIKANIEYNGNIEELPLVAKLPPITNDLYWEIFQPERTCLTENAVYKYLSPAIRDLQSKANISKENFFDGFPRYYGSRISLDPAATKVDRDAVLVLENLQTSGYKAGNRHQMFDYEHIKLILENVAKYHALPIALRHENPECFDKYIRPYVHRFNMNAGIQEEARLQMKNEVLQVIEIATNNNAKSVDRFKELWQRYDDEMEKPDPIDGPFTTLVHCDMWINNLLLKYDNDGKPTNVKFVDFQVVQYESLARDVVFLLFSSVDTNTLEEKFNDLLKIYYNSFINALKSVNQPTNEYTFEAFMNEIKHFAPLELVHSLFMTQVILADNKTLPDDFKDMNFTVLSKNVGVIEVQRRFGDIIRLAEKFQFLY